MGIIDINVEKPAFKRIAGMKEPVNEPISEDQEPSETTGHRGRTLLKTVGALTIGVLGMMTVRKLRSNNEGGPQTEE